MSFSASSSSNNSLLIAAAVSSTLAIGASLIFSWRSRTAQRRYTESRSQQAILPTPSSSPYIQWLSQSNREVLEEIVDAFVPEVSEEDLEEHGVQLVEDAMYSFCPTFVENNSPLNHILEDPAKRAFLRGGAKSLGVADAIIEGIGKLLLKEERASFTLVLSLLGITAGNMLLTGYPLPFQQLPLNERENALRRLRDSMIPDLRSAYQTFRRLTGSIFAGFPFTDPGNGLKANPNWKALEYNPAEMIQKPPRATSASAERKIPSPVSAADDGTGVARYP